MASFLIFGGLFGNIPGGMLQADESIETVSVAESSTDRATKVDDKELAALQDSVHGNVGKLSSQFGRKRLTEGEKTAAIQVLEDTEKILSRSDLTDEFRIWTVARRTVALIHLAYDDRPKYFPLLLDEVETLEARDEYAKIAKVAGEHSLRIASDLALRPLTLKNGKVLSVNLDILADWLIDYAQQYPGRQANLLIYDLLDHIDGVPSIQQRDKLLAVVAERFAKHLLASEDRSDQSLGRRLATTLRRVGLVGKPMRLVGFDLKGKPFDAKQLQNKVVLVDFWGTWCIPCREETPNLIKLYEQFKSQGFEIVGINTGTGSEGKGSDKDPDRVREYVEKTTFGSDKKKITWPILLDSLLEKEGGVKVSDYYDIDKLPMSILIGRDGNVIKVNPLPSGLAIDIRKALATGNELEEDEEIKAALQKQDEELKKEIEGYMKERNK